MEGMGRLGQVYFIKRIILPQNQGITHVDEFSAQNLLCKGRLSISGCPMDLKCVIIIPGEEYRGFSNWRFHFDL